VHKAVLETGCPYFETLFSTRLPTQEVAENKIILDSTVDCEDAWSMVIEYLYLGDYGITGRRLVSPNGKGKGQELKRNARVYVLALKLCMEELKMLAIKKTEALLAGFYDGVWYLTPYGLQWVVEIVYPNTPEGKGQCADERKYKSQTKKKKKNSFSATDFWQMNKYRVIRCGRLLQSTPRRCSPNSGEPKTSWIWYRIGASSRGICFCTPRTVRGCPILYLHRIGV
jgi:hypothetical protein